MTKAASAKSRAPSKKGPQQGRSTSTGGEGGRRKSSVQPAHRESQASAPRSASRQPSSSSHTTKAADKVTKATTAPRASSSSSSKKPSPVDSKGKGRQRAASARRSDVSASALVDSVRVRGSTTELAGDGGHRVSSVAYSSQVRRSSVTSPSRRRSTNSRFGRRMTVMVGVSRLQRAVRRFLLHHALQHVPVGEAESVELCSSSGVWAGRFIRGNASHSTMDSAELRSEPRQSATPLLLVPTESRLVHRIRAELYRTERLDDLRIAIARRTMTAALREWVRVFRARRAGIVTSFGDGERAGRWFRRPGVAAVAKATEEDTAAGTVQAFLRAMESRRLGAQLVGRRREWEAAARIQRAWRRCPLHSARSRLAQDEGARAVLCAHEALERRELLRRHLAFLVRCHQRLYNDPRMWEAGLAVRRLPLYTPDGLYLSYSASPYAGGPLQSLMASTQNARDAACTGDEGQFSPYATIPKLLQAAESSSSIADLSDSAARLERHGSARRRDATEAAAWWDKDGLDVDAGLRFCQYRLHFTPEDRRLLAAAAADGFDDSPAHDEVRSPVASDGVMVSDCREMRSVVPHELVEVTEAPFSAKAFASALTFLREPPVVPPATPHIVHELERLRRDPAQLERVLAAHGHLPADLVAPLAAYGPRYQRVARGEEDAAALHSTEAMRVCQPRVVGVVPCPALELRHCLVSTAVSRGPGVEGELPAPLTEHQCRVETAATSGGAEEDCAATAMLASYTAAAALQRSGFASVAVEALFARVSLPTAQAATAQEAMADAGTEDGAEAAALWDHRLATGVDDVGAQWRSFLLSLPLAPPPRATARDASLGPIGPCASAAPRVAAANAGTLTETHEGRRRVGFASSLTASGSAAPALLSDFAPRTVRPPPGTAGQVESVDAAAADTRGTPPESDPRSARAKAAAASAQVSGVAPLLVGVANDWCDQVERMLIQERTTRASLASNEADQRRSVAILRRIARVGTQVQVGACA